MKLLLALLLALALSPTAVCMPSQDPAPEDPRQILWLPDLAQAQALAQATGRPLFLAVNMDGESASERIVREMYRDPEFVALTRRAVCLVSSVFRHTPRDFDDQGRRIPCPRLGRVTCGEHMALEPVLYDKYLGGQRIAPRHAFVTPEGEVRFDLFLLFDLNRITEALRTELEPWPLPMALQPMPKGQLESWRMLLGRASTPSAFGQLEATARELELIVPAAAEARRELGKVTQIPPDLACRAHYLDLLVRLDPEDSSSRTRLLAHATLNDAAAVDATLDAAFGKETASAIRRAILGAGGPLSAIELLHLARAVRQSVPCQAMAKPEADPDILRIELADAVDRLSAASDDPAALAAVGRASLALAKWSIDAGEAGGDIYLQDAQEFLDRARQRIFDDPALLIASARAAYHSGDFEAQETFALEALQLLGGFDDPLPQTPEEAAEQLTASPQFFDALQWLGDAAGRLLGRRSGADPLVEAAGMFRGGKALLLAAIHPQSDEVDWQSAASFLGAVGLPLQELAWLDEGRRRFPDSNLLANEVINAVWRAGRPELAVSHAQEIAAENPEMGACTWYVGYSQALLGNWCRRQEDPEGAIAAYRQADEAFRSSLETAPEFAQSVRFWRARLALSRGFAHLLVGRQLEAAACLVEGIALDPNVARQRDGLDREAVDLLDGALEWRQSGASPVDPLQLTADLLRADPGNALWPRSVADSELREALRADGRGEFQVGDDYLRTSLEAAEQALTLGGEEEDIRVLAQDLTIFAERLLARNKPDAAVPYLARAAPLLDLAPPEANASREQLRALAALLRADLGEPRPINRPGR